MLFKTPTTKIGNARRKSLAKRDVNFPAPGDYQPEMWKTEKNFFLMPVAVRMPLKKADYEQPGPGKYEVRVLSPGLKKSMLGGKLDPNTDVDNGVPGPNAYFEQEDDIP